MVRRLAHKESRKWRRSLTRMRTIDRRMPTALTRTVTTVRMRICSIQIWRTLRGARNQRSTTPVAQNTCTDSTNWSWSLFSFTTTREICRRRVRNSSICSWKMASKSSKNTQMIRMLAKPWGSNRSKWPRSKTWEMKARPMGWWCHRNSRLWRKSNKTVKRVVRDHRRDKRKRTWKSTRRIRHQTDTTQPSEKATSRATPTSPLPRTIRMMTTSSKPLSTIENW